LSDEEKTRHGQSAYSDKYFTELSKSIHTEADKRMDLFDYLAVERWSCPESQCFLRQGITFKSYIVVHLQEYHNEDVGCTREEELAGLSLDPLGWRCLNCLFQNFVPQQGYVCGDCKLECEEFRMKARIKLSSKDNIMGMIQQDSPSAHASTIALSKSSEQGKISPLGTPLDSGPQTLQPHLSLPEPVTGHRDASNAALALPVTRMAIQPTIAENRHQGGNVEASPFSGSYFLNSPLFCPGNNCRFELSTFAEFQLHFEENHDASVRRLVDDILTIYNVCVIVQNNLKSSGLTIFYRQIVQIPSVPAASALRRRILKNTRPFSASTKCSSFLPQIHASDFCGYQLQSPWRTKW
jgi:hypothetical protein